MTRYHGFYNPALVLTVVVIFIEIVLNQIFWLFAVFFVYYRFIANSSVQHNSLKYLCFYIILAKIEGSTKHFESSVEDLLTPVTNFSIKKCLFFLICLK